MISAWTYTSSRGPCPLPAPQNLAQSHTSSLASPLALRIAALALQPQVGIALKQDSGGTLNGPQQYKPTPFDTSQHAVTPCSSESTHSSMPHSSSRCLGCHLNNIDTKSVHHDTHPIYLLESDNTAGESWLAKGCTSSTTGRKFARLQAALLLAQGAGYRFVHVDTKMNFIADSISCIPSEIALPRNFPRLLAQATSLNGCWCFLPNATLISSLVDLLL